MRPDSVRLMTFAISVMLVSGCAGVGSNRLESLVHESFAGSEQPSDQHPERRPKTTIETSLSHGDGLTLGTASVSVAAMLPVDPPDRMLLVKPMLAAHILDAPLDTPSRLFSAGVNIMWLQRLNDETALTIAANPSVGGDEAEFGRRLRVFAMGPYRGDVLP